MPWQWFIDIIADEKQHVQPQTYRIDNSSVAAKIFQITNQDEFEEYNRVNALLAFAAIIFFSCIVDPMQIQSFFKPAVKIFRRYTIGQLKLFKQFFRIMFFSLHASIYKGSIVQIKYLYKQGVSCATSTYGL